MAGTTVEPRAAAPEQRAPHFAGFDGFRAIAALSVLVTHVAFYTGQTERPTFGLELGDYLARLDMGVAIFFLISGFLLYRPFVEKIFRNDSLPALGPYLKRRALRIFPAYWLCLTLVVYVIGYGSPTPQYGLDFDDFILRYGLLQIYSTEHVVGGPVQQAWTLCVEVSFYLFLPVYAWLMSRKARTPAATLRVQLLGVALLYVGSVGYRAALLASDVGTGTYRTWLPGFLDQFALGMALAIVSVWLVREPHREWSFLRSRWFPWCSWAAALACFVIVSKIVALAPAVTVPTGTTKMKDMANQFLYGATAFFLLLPGVFGPPDKGFIRRFLRNPAVVWLGLVSYGIYLWHEVALDVFFRWDDAVPFGGRFWPGLGVSLVLTVAAAAVSYYVLERPALRLKDRALWSTR